MSHKHKYIETMKDQLDALDASIQKLEGAAQVGEVQVMTTYQENLKKLQLQAQKALAKLEEIKAAGENSWTDLTAEMEKNRDALIHSFHYFKSQV
jgi:hypothetical protein